VLTIAYLANQFPSPLEPYIAEEILELRRQGVKVIPCSARHRQNALDSWTPHTLYLQALKPILGLRALWLCYSQADKLLDFLGRILFKGRESPWCRIKALLHTWLGAYLALLLNDHGVGHIHVHHGYFSAWIAMVAARLLDITYSMTLHGSDLLLSHTYLDLKLANCSACFTVSEYNLNYIRQHYPLVDDRKLILRRLGVDVTSPALMQWAAHDCFTLLAVGRLHRVKDHEFLLRGCAALCSRGMNLQCLIAGDGPEKESLVRQVRKLGLENQVKLLGHIAHSKLASLYCQADLVVLTSRSEGIPVVLMEAMARGIPVLAPNITGIPELIVDGQSGFLYKPGSLQDFVERVEFIRNSLDALDAVRRTARQHVMQNFDRQTNLRVFADALLHRAGHHPGKATASEGSRAQRYRAGARPAIRQS
jgi:glycosyltransferase involved in cell wall biosynthesis